METVTDFIFLGSKITAEDDCSHEIKTCLLLGRKESYDQSRQHIKSRDITLPTNIFLSKLFGKIIPNLFPVFMYGC